jgi:arylformamidase
MMKRIYDISVSIAQDLPVWPGDPQVLLEKTSSLDAGDEANVTFLKMSAHTGTHLDAPNHFLTNGITIDEINPEVLIGPAQVVVIPDHCSRITSGIVSEISIKNGIERILFKTINSSFWEKNTDFQKGFTAITADGAQSLVEKNLKLVGMDYLSISPFEDTVTPHRIFLEAGVIILEGINLAQVPEGIYELICLPLKIKGGDGAPARAVLRAMV